MNLRGYGARGEQDRGWGKWAGMRNGEGRRRGWLEINRWMDCWGSNWIAVRGRGRGRKRKAARE